MPMVLEGITVIELATEQQGPVAGALLADMGADVIKVEDKDHGDPGRKIRTETPGQEPFPSPTTSRTTTATSAALPWTTTPKQAWKSSETLSPRLMSSSPTSP